MNNKFFNIFIIMLTISASAQADCTAKSFCACSHSFFSIRPVFQASTPERVTLFRDAPLARDCGWNGAIQVVGFGGKSTNAKNLARYFTPNCSDTVIFAETNATTVANPHLRDISSVFFNVRTTERSFNSCVQFKPRHTFAGAGFDWKQYIDWWRCDCPAWWVEVSFPVVHVKNDMHLTETIISGGTFVAGSNTSITEAFTGVKKFVNLQTVPAALATTGNGWQFGKIACSRKKTGVADVEFKLGYDFLNSECCHLDGYVGFVAPTGNKPRAEFVFEPIIGNNHHWGIMWGSSFGGVLWEGCNSGIRAEIETNGRYLFHNTQRRSFDPINSLWGRYLIVYTSAAAAVAQTPVEGINFFTQKLHVNPGYQQHINLGLIYDWCNFQAEIGYHFWGAQCEQVKLKDPFPTGLAFPNLLSPTDATVPNQIDLCLNINGRCDSGGVFYTDPRTITEADLNLESAAHPCIVSHTVYGSLGYQMDWCWPLFVGIGGSYELGAKRVNTALNRWMVWGKIGVSI